jgi:8-oxo-dGTP pyrophosphatase MutT (NUDIX family)
MIVLMLKTLRNTLVHTWYRFKRPMTLGVKIIAVRSDGCVCLVRHTYTPGWHLPGGGVERGENCLEAAIKEIREEAGLVVLPSDMTLRAVHSNFANFPDDHVVVFSTRVWTQIPTDNAHEIAEFGFFDSTDLPEGTTPATKRRLAEFAGGAVTSTW